MAVDKVRPLKIETPTDGTETDPFPQETDPAEDYLAGKGIAFENLDTHLIDRSGNDIQFTDPNLGTESAFDLLYKQWGVSVYTPFSPWSAKAGTSDPIPFESADFETDSSIHDSSVHDSGTATSGTATTLVDTSKSWTVNQFAGYNLKLTGGTGSGQWRAISSNTADTLTVSTWDTNPDNTTTYEISLQSRLVAPVDGIYHVMGHASISYQAGVLGVFFYVNGAFNSLNYEHQGQTIELNGNHTRPLNLSANDYVEMRIYNGGGAPYSMFGGRARLWFSMVRR